MASFTHSITLLSIILFHLDHELHQKHLGIVDSEKKLVKMHRNYKRCISKIQDKKRIKSNPKKISQKKIKDTKIDEKQGEYFKRRRAVHRVYGKQL